MDGWNRWKFSRGFGTYSYPLGSISLECICTCAPGGAIRNCLWNRYFTIPGRGIGYSFQLAITAPLYSIIGYCIATAQSCSLSYNRACPSQCAGRTPCRHRSDSSCSGSGGHRRNTAHGHITPSRSGGETTFIIAAWLGLRVSDGKLVHHTTEMILWSMILSFATHRPSFTPQSRRAGLKMGIARTQIPTNKNYALELLTFETIVGVSSPGVQWTGLTLGEPPSWSWLTPAPGKYNNHSNLSPLSDVPQRVALIIAPNWHMRQS